MATVLIWLGSGFVFSIGVMLGVWLMRRAHGDYSRTTDVASTLLAERNEIGKRQAAALERLAAAAERES